MIKISVKKVILTIFLVIAIAITGTVGYGYYLLNKIKVDKKTAPPRIVEITEPVNVLLMGLDAGELTSKKKDKKRRSDTMMILRYFPKENKMYVLSVPRDTKTEYNDRTIKMNATHYFVGPEYTIKTIENMLGIDINYYAEVDYQGFRACIDAIGGVDIVIPRDMDYDAWDIKIHFKKGELVHLDGEKAEQFVRWRKNNDSPGYATGDLGRIETQQQFIVKVGEKLKSFSGILKLPSLLNTLTNYVNTNMDSTTMLQYAFKMRNIKASSIEKRIIPGIAKKIHGTSYYIYDNSKELDYLTLFKTSSPTFAKTNNSLDEDEIAIDKKAIKVSVLNSTNVPGLAKQYKEKLVEYGYNVVEIGNYKEKNENTVIKDYSNNSYGQLISNDIKFNNVKHLEKNNSKSDVVIILGKDSIK